MAVKPYFITKWSPNTMEVIMEMPPMKIETVSPEEALQAAINAADTWNQVDSNAPRISVTEAKWLQDEEGISWPDGHNTIVATTLAEVDLDPDEDVHVQPNALMSPAFNLLTFDHIEADVYINTNAPYSVSGADDRYDLESSFVHEFGHLLGLQHSEEEDSSMYHEGFYTGATHGRDPTTGDEQALILLYGDAMSCSSVDGQCMIPMLLILLYRKFKKIVKRNPMEPTFEEVFYNSLRQSNA